MTGAVYGYKAPVTTRSSAGASSFAPPAATVAASAPAVQTGLGPVVGGNGVSYASSSVPMTDATPAALFAASALACYFEVPYSSLLLLLGAAAAAYAVYKDGLSSVRWWVWALAAVAVYMYSAGPCSGQLDADYARAADLLGYS